MQRRLSLVLAIAAAFCSRLTPAAAETVELDLVFPRNETYRPIYPFPIVFALRNPAALWPFDFTLTAKLEWWSHEENRTASTSAGFDQLGHFPNSDSGAYDHSPVYPDDLGDPLFIINSSIAVADIRQDTTAAISWDFGLQRNCTADRFLGRVELSFASDGVLPSFANDVDEEQCPVVAVGAIGIAGQMQPTGPEADIGTCAILQEEQPEPDPCALTIDKELATRVAEAMMASIYCDGATGWPDPTATSCEQLSVGSRTVKDTPGWISTVAIIVGVMLA
ncbi:hypothetical protein BJX61DRAFT_547510 [Aspergillus egyptiacus]|nr:hypothetical protein BJX61DRAFT_547510 [Aspergillus egyptiacus]